MMYIHYCRNCRRIHMLNGHKLLCPTCDQTLAELSICYMDYIQMDLEERRLLLTELSEVTFS